MQKQTKFWVALLIAVILMTFMSTAVSARRISPWVGRWQTMDIPGDGSTNTLKIKFSGGASNYKLKWQETYFSICSGDPGVGRGTGTEGLTGLHTNFDFYCRGTLTTNIDIEFTYNPSTDTITSDAGGITQTWIRISPRPW